MLREKFKENKIKIPFVVNCPKYLCCQKMVFGIFGLNRRKKNLLNLQKMGPPQFKKRVPCPHSLKIENGEK